MSLLDRDRVGRNRGSPTRVVYKHFFPLFAVAVTLVGETLCGVHSRLFCQNGQRDLALIAFVVDTSDVRNDPWRSLWMSGELFFSRTLRVTDISLVALFSFRVADCVVLHKKEVSLMGRIAIFIDGAYLQYTLRDEFNSARISFEKLVTRMAGGREILRSYYYNCEPYQSNPPTLEEKQRFSRAQSFFYALDQLPRFQVRLGKLEFRGCDGMGKPIFHQKRVDTQMGVDLVLLAAKNSITDAAILAGDSDFLPAIDAAKPEGVVIHLFHGEHPHTDLVARCDERTKMDQPFIDSILM